MCIDIDKIRKMIDELQPMKDLKIKEETMKDNYCMACGQLQQYGGDGSYICERCGAENGDDGCSYDGSRSGQEDMDHRINDYDKRYPY